MHISEIAQELNKRLRDGPFSDFQEKRAERLGNTRPRSRALFSKKTIQDDYAYHDGGRSETQFNIGYEDDLFRYGIAFSFQKGHSLPDPVRTMEPRVRIFNKLVGDNPELVSGLSMWRFHSGKRSQNLPASKIPDNWILDDSFIFVGKYKRHKGDTANATGRELNDIVSVFEQLKSVYDEIESVYSAEDRYVASRLTWNSEGWRKPSGPEGKTRNSRAFESIHGFGFEEWLFDVERVINGYHYTFLQPLNRSYNKYRGQRFDVLLYTINDSTRRRYWVGRILGLRCISPDEADRVMGEYMKNGWLGEMVSEAEQVGGDGSQLKGLESIRLFNCKYKIEDMEIFDEPFPEISRDDDYIQGFYYGTFTKLPADKFYGVGLTGDRSDFDFPDDLSEYDASGIQTTNSTRRGSGKEVSAEHRHKEWQKKLLCSLRKRYGEEKAGVEVPSKKGYVDILLKVGKATLIIELKTANSAVQIVREAVGQLLEYGYWPGVERRNYGLIASGIARLDSDTARYLEYLRNYMGLPIWYLRLNPDDGELLGLDEVCLELQSMH